MSKDIFDCARDGLLDNLSVLLEEGAHVNEPKNGETLLCLAAAGGHIDCIKVLLSFDANVNQTSWYGESPLLRAAYSGHAECVKLLLNTGANVNLANKYDRTPLDWAATNGHGECVKLLLERTTVIGFNVDDELFRHVLDWNDTDAAAQFLSRYAEVFRPSVFKSNPYKLTNSAGCTALHLSVLSRRPAREVAILVNKYPGALHMRDSDLRTPLDIAKGLETDPDVLSLLMGRSNTGSSSSGTSRGWLPQSIFGGV